MFFPGKLLSILLACVYSAFRFRTQYVWALHSPISNLVTTVAFAAYVSVSQSVTTKLLSLSRMMTLHEHWVRYMSRGGNNRSLT